MFLNLPNTPEVLRAKNELLQMMEDKYTELKDEGKTENEAVGCVISEFGNLDELAESLGIDQVVSSQDTFTGRMLSMEEVKHYISDYLRHAFLTALGIALCIASVMGPVIGDALEDYYNVSFYEVIGTAVMFIMIAAGVSCIVYSGIMIGKWSYLKKQQCVTDFATTEYLNQTYENNRSSFVLQLTIGIALIIVSFIPGMIGDAVSPATDFYETIGIALMFFLVAVGVFLIVMSCMRSGCLKSLLALNRSETVGGGYVRSQDEFRYHNPAIKKVMSVYWPTVTAVYLIISFLTFHWEVTWVIWPIAALLDELLKHIDGGMKETE